MRIDSKNDLTTEVIVDRIIQNRAQYQARNAKKNKKEVELIESLKDKEGASGAAASSQ